MSERHEIELGTKTRESIESCGANVGLCVMIGLSLLGLCLLISSFIVGCVSPGAARVETGAVQAQLFTPDTIRVAVETGAKAATEWLDGVVDRIVPATPPGDGMHNSTNLLTAGLSMYGIAEVRKFLRDRNGKAKT